MDARTAVVTGGAKGIGRAIGESLAQRGYGVALIDKDEAALAEAVDELRTAHNRPVAGVAADLRRREACHRAFAEAADALGHVDVLVNNAGVYIRTPIEQIDDAEWDLIFDVCLRSVFHLSAAAAAHMRERGGGRIVNIASTDGFVGFPQMAHYAAAKAGVVSLTRSFAMTYAADGILVNGVAPGATDTPPMRVNDYHLKVVEKIPLGRCATPGDIAQAVCFLADPANSYMTGETMIVSGGLVIA